MYSMICNTTFEINIERIGKPWGSLVWLC